MTPQTLDERISRACCQLALIVAAVTAQDPAVLDVAADDVHEAVFGAALDALTVLRPLRQAPADVLRWTPPAVIRAFAPKGGAA